MSSTDVFAAQMTLSAEPTDQTPCADEADTMAAAIKRAELRVRVLQELTEMGMDITRVLHTQVLAAATAPDKGSKADEGKPPADPAASFAKLSRAIRLTIDLEARVDEALRALIAGETTARENRREAREQSALKAGAARSRAAVELVRKQVGVAIARESESEEEEDALLDALEERLEEDEAYILAGKRPLRQVVEQLCGELGLTPDWSGWIEGEGWPDPLDAPPYRSRWSEFNEVSREPIVDRNRQ